MTNFEEKRGYARTFQEGKLTLGLFTPIESYAGSVPKMDLEEQTRRMKEAEEAGYAALWVRDIPFHIPTFGDAGQMYDPWVYLTYMSTVTTDIALGTASMILPIRHPIHFATSAASIDHLSKGRLLLGVASGDRPDEFPAFHVPMHERGDKFVEAFEQIRKIWTTSFPIHESSFGTMTGAGDVLPKPYHDQPIPMFVTGSSRQPLEWIGKHGDGWMYYPRNLEFQARAVKEWKEASGDTFKPFMQSLYIDLAEDPDERPTPIHLGFRTGRHALIKFLQLSETIGVNHIILNFKYGRRPIDDVLKEMKEYVVPHFSAIEE